ncbi:hypothetical protein [uncultured Ornithinimicrobium sp.]|uniref:hypothetical protein n=1 Tax=uncultured Ornithinimicrobium sp. TaxID=259307 RepID=UPI00259A5E5C|nr:hypothetical protein [uncultured Ornithinimicrobium sp.]
MVHELLLLPSPLLPVSAYDGLAATLQQTGADVRLALLPKDDVPHAKTLVRTWSAMVGPGTTLIAHSNAGYLAPSVRDRAGTNARVIFMDAALPPESGPTCLAPSQFRDHLSSLAGDDGLLPPWTRWWSREDLDGVIPADDFDHLDRDCPRLPLSYFDAQLVAPQGWVEAPNAYLAFDTTYARELTLAQERGWPHTVTRGGHLHFLLEPVTVAAKILHLIERLPRS